MQDENFDVTGRLDLLPTDAVVTQREASMEQSRLVKLGLLPCDAAASQNKAVEELSRLMRLGVMLSDTAVSQRNALMKLSRLVKLGILPCDASEGIWFIDTPKAGHLGTSAILWWNGPRWEH